MSTRKTKKGKKAETLSRKYKGKTYTATRNPDGTFTYDGEVFRSLTGIAKRVTGYSSINGVAWFRSKDGTGTGGRKAVD